MVLARLSGCLIAVSACNPRLFDRLEPSARDAGADASLEADAGEEDGAAPSMRDAGGRGDAEAGMVEAPCPPVHPEGHVFKIASVQLVGTMPVPEGVHHRWVGASARVGDQLVWTFPSTTLTSAPTVGFASVAYADPARPLELSENVDEAGLPRPFIPRLPEEDDPAFSLLSMSLVPASDHTHAWLFFQRVFIFHPVAVGLARVEPGAQEAERVEEMFFDQQLERFSMGGFAHEGNVYLYGPEGGVVRAPVDEVDRPESYRAYRAEFDAWVPDLTQATPVLPEGWAFVFSVSYNRYLGGFLLVRSSERGDTIEMFLAARPEGPFEPLGLIETERSLVPECPTEQALEQLPLREACDKRITLSYLRPLEGRLTELGTVVDRSETHLLEVEFE